MEKYLAVDIGASSGRIFEAALINKKIELKEIYRFDEYLKYEENTYFWDMEKIYGSIMSGLKKYFKENREEDLSIGIDTWGVDFVLLDSNDKILGRPVSYRDSRTNGMMEKVFGVLAKEKIYEKTGIQFMEFNTLFQLYSLKLKDASFDGVYVDNIRGVFALTEYLIKKGEKDITIITGDKNSNISLERIEGYKEALYMNGIEISNGHIVFADFYDSHKIEKSLKSVIAEKNYPKTLICCNNIILQTVIKLIMQNNLKINKDITVVSFDNTDFLDNLGFKISCVSPDLDTLVSQSINLILENILNKKNTTRQIDIIPELVEKK